MASALRRAPRLGRSSSASRRPGKPVRNRSWSTGDMVPHRSMPWPTATTASSFSANRRGHAFHDGEQRGCADGIGDVVEVGVPDGVVVLAGGQCRVERGHCVVAAALLVAPDRGDAQPGRRSILAALGVEGVGRGEVGEFQFFAGLGLRSNSCSASACAAAAASRSCAPVRPDRGTTARWVRRGYGSAGACRDSAERDRTCSRRVFACRTWPTFGCRPRTTSREIEITR